MSAELSTDVPDHVRAPARMLVYGMPPSELVTVPSEAVQVSPLVPGSVALDASFPEGSLAGAFVVAPPGTIERRYTLALTLRALAIGGSLVALAPKEKGGQRLGKELRGFGCDVDEEGRRHHRICRVVRPSSLDGLSDALWQGAPCHVDNLSLCTQPGIFSWNRLDPGSALLLEHLPALSGRGADFGCGIGVLSRSVLASEAVTGLTLVDIDRRAVEMARRNIVDPRAETRWADIRLLNGELSGLDFVVMNPPFHDGGAEDRALGKSFIAKAAEALRSGGTLWLTANAHLPYEASLRAVFRTVTPIASEGGYKVYEARK